MKCQSCKVFPLFILFSMFYVLLQFTSCVADKALVDLEYKLAEDAIEDVQEVIDENKSTEEK